MHRMCKKQKEGKINIGIGRTNMHREIRRVLNASGSIESVIFKVRRAKVFWVCWFTRSIFGPLEMFVGLWGCGLRDTGLF